MRFSSRAASPRPCDGRTRPTPPGETRRTACILPPLLKHFKNIYDFNEMLASNKPLIMAKDIILNSKSNKKDILNILKKAQQTTLLQLSSQLKALIDDISKHEESISKKYRAEIAETIEKISMFLLVCFFIINSRNFRNKREKTICKFADEI